MIATDPSQKNSRVSTWLKLIKEIFSSAFQGATRKGPVRDQVFFEVSESSIKALHLQKSNDRFKIQGLYKKSFVSQNHKQGLTASGIKEFVQNSIREINLDSLAQARVLLIGKGIFITEVEKPDVAAKDLEQSVVWQIAEKATFPIEEAKVVMEKKGTHSVFVAAVQNAKLDAVIQGFHEAGVQLELITVLPLAYEGLNPYEILPPKTVLLVHSGKDQTSFLIFQNGMFKMQRDLALGGEHITQAMMGTLMVGNAQMSIGYQEAEALKEAIGLPTSGLAPNPDEPKLSQLSARVRPIFEKMVSEIRSTVIQYQKRYPEEKISELYLSGDEAKLKGFDDYLTQQLSMTVQIIRLKGFDPEPDPSLTGLLGLENLKPNCLNFAPIEDIWSEKFENYERQLKTLTALLTACFLVVFAALSLQLLFTHKEKKAVEKKFKSLGAMAQKIESIDHLDKKIVERKELLKQNIREQPYWGALLRELSQIVPPTLTLKSLVYSLEKDSKRLEISGVILHDTPPPDLMLSKFLESLNQSVLFENSRLESSERLSKEEESSGLQFLISADLVVPYEE